MICIAEGRYDPRYSGPIQTMFEDRKRLFVDLLRWGLEVEGGRWEIDRFDDDQATYIIACNQAGDHAGSIRLLPTEKPHILSALFPDLCAEGVPVGPDVQEVTRLCLPLRHGANERLRIRNALISAMVDHALASGISYLTGVVEAGFLEQVMAMGWRCRRLGSLRRFGGAPLGAFCVEIDRDTPALLAATGIWLDGNSSPRSSLELTNARP